MSSASRLYRVSLGLALLGAGASIVAGLAALSRIQPGVPSASAVATACRNAVPLSSVLAILVIGAATAALAVLGLAARSILRQLREQHAFRESLRTLETVEVGGRSVSVVEGRRPRAFCAGLIRPRIFLSTAVLELLSEAELTAIVAHEHHHQSRRDPLRIFVARALADALFFLPGLKRLGRRYRELSELAADEAARSTAGSEALAAALLSFGERSGEQAAAVGIAPERVDHLLGQSPRWKLPLSIFAGSLLIVAVSLGLATGVPVLVPRASVSPAMLFAASCMATMIALPVVAGVLGLSLSRRLLRRADSG